MPNPTSKLNLVINGVTTQLDIHDANAVDLTNNQTVGGNKEFTGTTTAHDLVPSATDIYNFGSSTAQWNNAYIKSLTINGTQFLPNNYMTLNTLQTVTSAKNYTNYQDINPYRLRIKSPAQEKGVIPASNQWNGFVFCDKNNEYMFSIEQGVMPNGIIQLNFAGRANDNDTTYTVFLRYINNSDLTTNYVNIIDLLPFGNGIRKLGDTNAKWKSFNGINPGALSLWSNNYISLDTTGFDVTSTTIGTFTPTVDGWATLVIGQKNKPFGIWLIGGTIRESFYSVKNNDDYFVYALIPVRANVSVNIYCIADDIDSTRKVDWLRLFPCQGNV